MELHREVKGEEEDRGDQGEKRGIRTRETDLASNSLSVLHSLEHPKIFTELGREEKGEGGDRDNLGKKRESEKGREQSSQ